MATSPTQYTTALGTIIRTPGTTAAATTPTASAAAAAQNPDPYGNNNYGPSSGLASISGYLTPEQSQRALASLSGAQNALQSVQGQYGSIAQSGLLSPETIQARAGAANQTVRNQTQAAAANAYRGAGGPDPFLSAAVAGRGAAAAGQAQASTRADLLAQNDQSRMQALSGLAGLVGQATTLGQSQSQIEQNTLTPEERAAQFAQAQSEEAAQAQFNQGLGYTLQGTNTAAARARAAANNNGRVALGG